MCGAGTCAYGRTRKRNQKASLAELRMKLGRTEAARLTADGSDTKQSSLADTLCPSAVRLTLSYPRANHLLGNLVNMT